MPLASNQIGNDTFGNTDIRTASRSPAGWLKVAGLVALALAVLQAAEPQAGAQTFNAISFTGSNGAAPGQNPTGSLTLSGTTLYGTTFSGGANGIGNIFSIGTNLGGFQNLVNFTGTGGTAAGIHSYGNVTLSLDGSTLYGMTDAGGNGFGTVFSVGVDGSGYETLASFTASAGTAPGANPEGSLILSLDGSTLYGMTNEGGVHALGNVFSIGVNGSGYQDLVDFTGGSGGVAPTASLTLSGSTLYGMTNHGGNGFGTVFSVGVNGSSHQNLVEFTGTSGTASGGSPLRGSLILSGSRLYGMTMGGGNSNDGTVFSLGVDGSGYETLASFTGTGGTASGLSPVGSLILSGTTLYGMTSQGGSHVDGNIFSLGIDGSGFQDLYDFTGGTGGFDPAGDVTLSGGTLFGMTFGGGAHNDGTVFAFALASTPEPGTLALLAAAAACAASFRWRRNRRANIASIAASIDDGTVLLALDSPLADGKPLQRRAA